MGGGNEGEDEDVRSVADVGSDGDNVTVPATARRAPVTPASPVAPASPESPAASEDVTVPAIATARRAPVAPASPESPAASEDVTVPAIPAAPRAPAGPQAPQAPRAPVVPAAPTSSPDPVASRARLVLGLAPGPTLAEVIGGEPMRVREVVRIGAEVATLLAHLHDHGRSHGAVSPANIVLGPGGGVQLVDVVGSAGGEVTGVGRVPPADDVHDLGVTMTTALNGAAGEPLPVDLPRTLRRVLLSAAEIDPALRPTARQLADMLAWAGRGQPRARPESLWTTSGSAAWAFGGAALLIVLLVLVGVVALSRDDPAAPGTAAESSTAAVSTTAPPDTAVPPATTVPATPTSAVPTPTATPTPTVVPTTSPGFELPTTLPALPTTLPALPTALPELPAEAQGLWDRFVDWLRGLF